VFDLILDFFIKNKLYNDLKKENVSKILLEDVDSICSYDVFPFHYLKIETSDYYSQSLLPRYTIKFKMTEEDVNHLISLFNPIFEKHSHKNYSIDISELDGFSNSKSPLNELRSIDEFVEKYCPSYIQLICIEQLKKMLNHYEIRIIHSLKTTSDNFLIYGWNDKLFLSNSGGSHHLAAAQYIAARLKEPVKLNAKIIFYTINQDNLNLFNEQYFAFIIPRNGLLNLLDQFNTSGLKFIKFIENNKNFEIYFFEKNNKNKIIISIFRQKYSSLFDILSNRLLAQNNNSKLKKIMATSDSNNY
jgi:hypothetical protein